MVEAANGAGRQETSRALQIAECLKAYLPEVNHSGVRCTSSALPTHSQDMRRPLPAGQEVNDWNLGLGCFSVTASVQDSGHSLGLQQRPRPAGIVGGLARSWLIFTAPVQLLGVCNLLVSNTIPTSIGGGVPRCGQSYESGVEDACHPEYPSNLLCYYFSLSSTFIDLCATVGSVEQKSSEPPEIRVITTSRLSIRSHQGSYYLSRTELRGVLYTRQWSRNWSRSRSKRPLLHRQQHWPYSTW